MKTPAFALPLLLSLMVPVGMPSPAAAGPDETAAAAPIQRFIQLDQDLYRGAQPDEAGFRYLKDLGIRTIVSFRNDTEERALVESLGMRFVNIPVTFRVFGWGDDFDAEDVRQFFSVVDDPTTGPIFFHCKRGADRTGSFAAIYRIARQGWTEDEALQEARDRGMRWWYFPMHGQVKDYAQLIQPLSTAQ
jgi:protein tyrosine/serine phosphatase